MSSELMDSQPTTPMDIENAITHATAAVKRKADTAPRTPTKMKKTRRTLMKDTKKGRTKVVSDKEKKRLAAAKRREEEAEQAKRKSFVPLPLGDLPDELKIDDEQSDPKHAEEGGKDMPIDLSEDDKKKDDSSSSSSSEENDDDDDVSSGSEDDDDADVQTQNVESGAESGADDFDEYPQTQVYVSDEEEQEQEQSVEEHCFDMNVLEKYGKVRTCDAEKLYAFAKTLFDDDEIEAFMKREINDESIKVDNQCFNIISSMVTGDLTGDKQYRETLMVMFIAELLKNIDETFTGIQNAFNQTSNYVDVRVKQVIQTVHKKSDGNKGIHTFMKQLFVEMESHNHQPEEVFKLWLPDDEDDVPNIEGILRTTKLEQLKTLISENANPNELNLLAMFPLDDLCILEDIESLRNDFREKNPQPKKPSMERALNLSSSEELHAYFEEYKKKDEAYKKKEKLFIETARHNAKKESFLLTLMKSTALILACCKKGDEESFQTLQKTIRRLAKAFKKRVKAAPEDVQSAVRLGYEKLRLYQNIFANEKSKPQYVEKSLAFCIENAMKMKKNNMDLQYIDYEPDDKKKDKKKNDVFYHLKSQKHWANRISDLQLNVNSKGKSCFLPPPILDEGLNDEVATEKKFKHFFAVLQLASMTHCLMDRRAFYHKRYYGLYESEKAACPCYRWNQALTLLSEVFVKPSDLKK